MATSTRTTKAGTIERTISITVEDNFGRTVFANVFEKTQLKTKVKLSSEVYTLERISSDFGVAFQVNKMTGDNAGECYDVCLNVPGGGHSCDCPHGTYRPNDKPCRHVEMCLQALRERKF